MPKSQTITIKYNNSSIKFKSTSIQLKDKRVLAAIELAEDYPDSSFNLLAQAAYPYGFVAKVKMLKSDVDDNLQLFLDNLKAIGIELKVEIKE